MEGEDIPAGLWRCPWSLVGHPNRAGEAYGAGRGDVRGGGAAGPGPWG